jgi:Flp pilus assembly protein TadG
MLASLQRSRPQRKERRRGAALVEMAVCFPVMMLILLGIIEFGRALSVNQMLNSAAREGCRTAVITGSTNAAVTSEIKERVANTVGCQQSSVGVQIAVTDYESGQAIGDVSLADTRDLIEVDVAVPYSAVSFSVSSWMTGKTLRGACDMRHE